MAAPAVPRPTVRLHEIGFGAGLAAVPSAVGQAQRPGAQRAVKSASAAGAPRLRTSERARTPRGPAESDQRREEALRTRDLGQVGARRLTKAQRRERQLANVLDVLRQAMAHSRKPVSYTHLTLPTKA